MSVSVTVQCGFREAAAGLSGESVWLQRHKESCTRVGISLTRPHVLLKLLFPVGCKLSSLQHLTAPSLSDAATLSSLILVFLLCPFFFPPLLSNQSEARG